MRPIAATSQVNVLNTPPTGLGSGETSGMSAGAEARPTDKADETTLSLTIPDEQWQNAGTDEDPCGRLMSPRILINAAGFRFEAYPVTNSPEHGQTVDSDDPDIRNWYGSAAQAALNQDSPFEVTILRGKPHVIFGSAN